MEVKKSKPVPVSEVKELLTNRKKDGELEYEQAGALEHAEKFTRGEASKDTALVKEMLELKMPEETAVKLVDIRPSQPETVGAILLKDRVDMSPEEIAQVLKALAK